MLRTETALSPADAEPSPGLPRASRETSRGARVLFELKQHGKDSVAKYCAQL